MPGVGHQKRTHAQAIAAAKLAADGLTHRQIAEQLGVPDDKIKAMIELGRRLQQAA